MAFIYKDGTYYNRSGSGVTVDSAISATSENPVQNKVIKSALDDKADLVSGKVPASQLPSYVDDVIEGYYNNTDGKFYEESTYTTEIIGEHGKIYVSLDTDYSYRWSGSAFVQIGGSGGGHTIKDNGTSVADESSLNFTDFDISDDSTNEETDIKSHRLTSSEMADICSPLPGAPYRQIEYSTEEQVIGKWIDGKPIYMKVMESTVPASNKDNTTDISGLNIDTLIECKCANKTVTSVPFLSYSAYNISTVNMSAIQCFCNLTTHLLYIRQMGTVLSAETGKTVYVILQYTKTTDTASQGD